MSGQVVIAVAACVLAVCGLLGGAMVIAYRMAYRMFERTIDVLAAGNSHVASQQQAADDRTRDLLDSYTRAVQTGIETATKAVRQATYGEGGDTIEPIQIPEPELNYVDWSDEFIPDDQREAAAGISPGGKIPGIEFGWDAAHSEIGGAHDLARGGIPAPDLSGEQWDE